MHLPFSFLLLAAIHSSYAAPIQSHNPLAAKVETRKGEDHVVDGYSAIRWVQEGGAPVSLIHRRAPSPAAIIFEDSGGHPIATIDQTATPLHRSAITAAASVTSRLVATSAKDLGDTSGGETLAISSNPGGMVGAVPAIGNDPGSSPPLTEFPDVAVPGAQISASTSGTTSLDPPASSSPATSDNLGAQDVTTIITTRVVTITASPSSSSVTALATSPATSLAPAIVPLETSSLPAAPSNAPDVLQQPPPAPSSPSTAPSNGDTFPLIAPSNTAPAASPVSSTRKPSQPAVVSISVNSVSASAVPTLSHGKSASESTTSSSELAIPIPMVFTITPPAIVTTLTIAPPNATRVSLPVASLQDPEPAQESSSVSSSADPASSIPTSSPEAVTTTTRTITRTRARPSASKSEATASQVDIPPAPVGQASPTGLSIVPVSVAPSLTSSLPATDADTNFANVTATATA